MSKTVAAPGAGAAADGGGRGQRRGHGSGRRRLGRLGRPGRGPASHGGPTRRLGRAALPYLLLVPALIFELAIHIIPMLVGAWMSLLQLTQFFIRNWTAAPYAGLANYRVAVDLNGPVGADLLHSFFITVAVTSLSLAGCWLLGLTAAVLLQKSFRGRAGLRTLFLVPYALPLFTAVITWRFMFQRDTGIVNAVLADQLHLLQGHPFWLLGGNSFASLVIVEIWRQWPFAFLILTAGLQSIPADLYEAADIDGAGFMKRLRTITLPMLRPVNSVLLLVLFLWIFNDFNTAYILFDRPPEVADVISIHIYNASFITWNFGQGSAMSVLLLGFLLMVTVGYLVAGRRRLRHA